MQFGGKSFRRVAAAIVAVTAAVWPGLALAGPAPTPLAYTISPVHNPFPPGSPTLAPQIASISPTDGTAGTWVTLKGSGFTGVTQVAFGGTAVTVLPQNDTTVGVSAPAGLAPGTSVQVGIPGTGAVAPQPFSYDIGSLYLKAPLPWYVYGCLGCPDSWQQGHSIDGPQPFYPDSVNYPHSAPHGTPIAVATPTPTFYVHAEFDPTGATPLSQVQSNSVYAYERGDVANFSATLETCAAPAPPKPAPPNPNCTDFAGNAGTWQAVQGGSDAVSVPLPQGNNFAVLSMPVHDSTPLDVAGLNLARTYRLVLRVYLEQSPGPGPTEVGNSEITTDTEYTSPFDVVLAPSALYQVDVLPYTLVYAPPGDQSSATYTISSSYGTTLAVGSTTNQSNSVTNEQDQSIKVSLQAGFQVPTIGVGAKINLSGTKNWDTSTSYGFGRTAASQQQQSTAAAFSDQLGGPGVDPTQVPGSGQVCAVKTGGNGNAVPDCSQISQAGGYFSEPFWRDTFYLLVHPQFAAWSYGGQERDVMVGAVSGLFSIDVYHLELCADGAAADASGKPPCQLNYDTVTLSGGGYTSHNGTETLTAAEAQSLLQLDPFYAGGGQAATLDPSRFSPVPQVQAFSYGASAQHDATAADVPTPVVRSFTLQDAQVQSTSGSSSFTAAVTDTVGSQVSVGGELDAGGASAGITYTTGESQKTQQQLQVTYQNSTATTQQNAVTTSATLNDIDNIDLGTGGSPACPKTCHGPLLNQPTLSAYLDNMFGGFLFQDPGAPPQPPHLLQKDRIGNILTVLQQSLGQGSGSGSGSGQGSGQSQGSGQPQGSGQSQGSGQVQGSGSGQQGQNPQPPGGSGQFSDVPGGYWAAAAIQTLVSKGIAGGFPDGSFRPDATLTRAQFLKLLVLTLGLKPGNGNTPFTDVSASDWFAPYVSAAVQAGLAQGVSPTSFDPGGTVTREQMAVLLARALKLSGKTALNFSDSAAVDGWAAAGVQAAVSAGYLSGFPDGSFKPQGPTTRAQAAKVLALTLQKGAAQGQAPPVGP